MTRYLCTNYDPISLYELWPNQANILYWSFRNFKRIYYLINLLQTSKKNRRLFNIKYDNIEIQCSAISKLSVENICITCFSLMKRTIILHVTQQHLRIYSGMLWFRWLFLLGIWIEAREWRAGWRVWIYNQIHTEWKWKWMNVEHS